MDESRLAPRLFLLAPKVPELKFLLPVTDQLPGYWRYRLPTTELLPASLINSQATDTTNWETKTLPCSWTCCQENKVAAGATPRFHIVVAAYRRGARARAPRARDASSTIGHTVLRPH